MHELTIPFFVLVFLYLGYDYKSASNKPNMKFKKVVFIMSIIMLVFYLPLFLLFLSALLYAPWMWLMVVYIVIPILVAFLALFGDMEDSRLRKFIVTCMWIQIGLFALFFTAMGFFVQRFIRPLKKDLMFVRKFIKN